MPPVPLIETDGVAVARCRSQRGMDRKQLAEAIGCSPQLITAIETGKINAAAATLRQIAGALGINISCLTYTGPLSLADRAITPHARQFALAAQQQREARLAARAAQKVA